MPSRKLTSHCPGCGTKNHLRAPYCNQCGKRLNDSRAPKDAEGRAKLYADIAHPINSYCREMIQDCVISEYYEEIERAKQPGYVSRYDDFEFEYSEASRNRPARFDQSHAGPAQSHAEGSVSTSGDVAGAKPHFRAPPKTDNANNSSPQPPSGEAFGAGIFPE